MKLPLQNGNATRVFLVLSSDRGDLASVSIPVESGWWNIWWGGEVGPGGRLHPLDVPEYEHKCHAYALWPRCRVCWVRGRPEERHQHEAPWRLSDKSGSSKNTKCKYNCTVKHKKVSYLFHILRRHRYPVSNLIIQGNMEGSQEPGSKQHSWLLNINSMEYIRLVWSTKWGTLTIAPHTWGSETKYNVHIWDNWKTYPYII